MSARKVSILLFGEGFENPSEAVELVIKAEELGFHRVWFSEHYTFNNLWCNAEPLVPICLSYTSTISIGCAGLLMRLHSPYRVANNFKLLASFFPERVDLGYASGLAGSDYLNGLFTDSIKNFTEQVIACSDLLNNDESLLERQIPVAPYMGNTPNEWILTSRYTSLGFALKHKLNVAFSVFHQGGSLTPQKEVIDQFRKAFFLKYGVSPQVSFAFSGVCDTDKKEAQKIYERSPYFTNPFVIPNFIGTPEELESRLSEIEESYGINDFVFMNLAEQVSEKLIGYEHLSKLACTDKT